MSRCRRGIPSSAISWTRSRAAVGSTIRTWRGFWSAPRRCASANWRTELGCFFDRNPDGTVHQKAFAGQTFDRTVHKGDLTGIEIINRLAEQVWRRDVRRIEDHRALDLIPSADGSELAGVLMLDMRTGEPLMVRARATLLATGGGPTMYKISHAVRRQILRRPGDGAARRPAVARHRDGAIPSHRDCLPAKARA